MKGARDAGDGRSVTMVLDRRPAGFEDLLGFGQSKGGRAYQEDDMRIVYGGADTDVLMILADGMGGHQGGAVASRLAVETFAEAFEAAEGSVAARLRASLDAANAAVGRRADDDADCWGMGCTLVACVVTRDESAHWVSVGDSPLWLLRGSGRRRTTRSMRAPERRSFDEAGAWKTWRKPGPHLRRGSGEEVLTNLGRQ